MSIRDVARAAGVSYQTVSRVINDSPSVKDSTRRAVLDAISSLGFRPNRAARALAGGPVQSVTVLLSNTRLYGFTAALEGIEEAAREAGFGLGIRVIESVARPDVRDAVERALEPAGALIVIAFDRPGLVALENVPQDVPTVAMIARPSEGEVPLTPWVCIDEYLAAEEATSYLLALGHHTVHHLSIPNWSGPSRREQGWRAALREAGVRAPKPLHGSWGADWGYEAGQQVAKDTKVSALLCGNDDIALGVMRAMLEVGRSVPGDVSIVGFDDVPAARFYTPALTTVRQDFKALGRASFAELLSVIGSSQPNGRLKVPSPQLIIRESTGPPRRGAPAPATSARGAVHPGSGGAKRSPRLRATP